MGAKQMLEGWNCTQRRGEAQSKIGATFELKEFVFSGRLLRRLHAQNVVYPVEVVEEADCADEFYDLPFVEVRSEVGPVGFRRRH